MRAYKSQPPTDRPLPRSLPPPAQITCAPLPKAPNATTVMPHWLFINGVQPQTEENAAVDPRPAPKRQRLAAGAAAAAAAAAGAGAAAGQADAAAGQKRKAGQGACDLARHGTARHGGAGRGGGCGTERGGAGTERGGAVYGWRWCAAPVCGPGAA